MPDTLLRVQVVIPTTGGVPDDSVSNTFYFDGDDGNSEEDYYTVARQMVVDFYGAIDGVLFPNTVDSPATMKMYDMRDATPRIPKFTDTFPITPTASDPFPSEVALCASFRAAQVSGVPAARRRGRLYIGPITIIRGTIIDGQSRPDSTAMTTLATACANLEDGGAMNVGSMKWAVYSPTTHLATNVDDAFNDVLDGWVDNAWDTQRRRGCDASARTLFT